MDHHCHNHHHHYDDDDDYDCGRNCLPQTFRYCSRKCRMKFNRKANPRKLKWTKAYRRTRGKELTMDTTFDFEQQRNRPPKYDRELYAQTIRAIQRISAIQLQRQRDFYYKRMKQSLHSKKALVKRELRKNIDLVLAPVAQRRREALMATAAEMETDVDMQMQKQRIKNSAAAASSSSAAAALLLKKIRKAQRADSDSDDEDTAMTV